MSTTPNPGAPALGGKFPQGQKTGWLSRVQRISLAAVVIVGCASVLMLGLFKLRESANRAKCRSNLGAIGYAILLYEGENAGRYPDSLATLLKTEPLTPVLFVCPSSNDEAAEGGSQAVILANMTKPHHVSYVYVGNGLTAATVKDDTLIAYELPANHHGEGMNMLFGNDGCAEWEPMAAAKALIAKATAATQP